MLVMMLALIDPIWKKQQKAMDIHWYTSYVSDGTTSSHVESRGSNQCGTVGRDMFNTCTYQVLRLFYSILRFGLVLWLIYSLEGFHIST